MNDQNRFIAVYLIYSVASMMSSLKLCEIY